MSSNIMVDGKEYLKYLIFTKKIDHSIPLISSHHYDEIVFIINKDGINV